VSLKLRYHGRRLIGCVLTCILAPLYLIQPGTVVSVVNSYAATSEYTPARLLRSVDFPTDGKPTTKNINGLVPVSIVSDSDIRKRELDSAEKGKEKNRCF
jgi:GTP:adenosylcobinamide-phosphate guanylyltransferase